MLTRVSPGNRESLQPDFCVITTCERLRCSPSEELVTVGVTGDTGKTTTTWLIRGIFEELSQLTGMIGAPLLCMHLL